VAVTDSRSNDELNTTIITNTINDGRVISNIFSTPGPCSKSSC
jgi:hypothetical protein